MSENANFLKGQKLVVVHCLKANLSTTALFFPSRGGNLNKVCQQYSRHRISLFFAGESHKRAGEYIDVDDVIGFCLHLMKKMLWILISV